MARIESRAARTSRERGQALIETALTLPLVLLISIGIFEFGRAFQTWQVLTNAAREGARVSVLPGVTVQNVETRVRDYMTAGHLTNVSSASVSVVRNAQINMGSGPVSASSVSVDYPFSFIVLNPVARLVVRSSNVGTPITMSAAAVMRNESPY
jgi:Flp pilus assembly protein TadG